MFAQDGLLLGIIDTEGTPAVDEVSDVADTRVPERSKVYGVLNGRRGSVQSAD